MMLLLTVYLWVAVFTACSILWEWPFTGSKDDYRQLRFKLQVAFDDSRRLFLFGYLVVLLAGTFLWPLVYWYRTKDVIRGLRK